MANSRWNLLLRMEEGVVLPVKKDWIRAIGVWHLNISKMTSCCRGTMDMFLHLNMNPKKNQEPKKNSWVFNYISHLSAKRKIILTATLKRECIYIYIYPDNFLENKGAARPLKTPAWVNILDWLDSLEFENPWRNWDFFQRVIPGNSQAHGTPFLVSRTQDLFPEPGEAKL